MADQEGMGPDLTSPMVILVVVPAGALLAFGLFTGLNRWRRWRASLYEP